MASTSNPLNTPDQRRLDAWACSIWSARVSDFSRLRKFARALYGFAARLRGAHADPYTAEDLSAAIDELVFSCIQKAVNEEPADPKVYCVDSASRSAAQWHGQAVPGGRYSYDNPDCIYRIIPVSSRYDYLISGRRFAKGPVEASFSLLSNPNSQWTISYLDGDDLVTSSDGHFEILVSGDKSRAAHFPNFLHCSPAGRQVFVRNIIGDWNEGTPDALTVTLLGSHQRHAPRSDDEIVARAKHHLKQCIFFYGFGALMVKTLWKRQNRITKPSQSSWIGTLTTQASAFGHFNLQNDEALVLTLRPGNALYWVVPVTSMGMLTLQPDVQITSMNSTQFKVNQDGTFTIIVSDQDIGAHNWIPIYGRTRGTIMARWHGLPADGTSSGSVAIGSCVLKCTSLRSSPWASQIHLGDTDERNAQIAARQAGYARLRFAYSCSDSVIQMHT